MELVIRATVIYWFLWLITRGTGKRSLAEISPLEMVVIVVLGDFVQQGVTEEDMSVTGAVIAVSTFAVWMLLSDFVSRRSKPLERILEGQAVIIVRGGALDMGRLRRERLTVDDIKGKAREQGIADIADVELCVLEHDGTFSFIEKKVPGQTT